MAETTKVDPLAVLGAAAATFDNLRFESRHKNDAAAKDAFWSGRIADITDSCTAIATLIAERDAAVAAPQVTTPRGLPMENDPLATTRANARARLLAREEVSPTSYFQQDMFGDLATHLIVALEACMAHYGALMSPADKRSRAALIAKAKETLHQWHLPPKDNGDGNG